MLTPLFSLLTVVALANPKQPGQIQREDLDAVQKEIQRLESSLSTNRQTEATLNSELQRLEKLLKLQALEIQLSTIELEKMEERLKEMELRFVSLEDTIEQRKKRLRDYLSILPSMEHRSPLVRLTENNSTQLSQYREFVGQVLAKDRGEILALKDHLNEVERLRSNLASERERILAHAEDLKEKQTILALNKDVKRDLLKKTRSEQGQKLQVYEAAKAAESELESMLSRLHKDAASAVVVAPATKGGGFAARKGSLLAPFKGEILSAFGKKYDAASSLYTFHKGIDIRTPPDAPVRAVFPGKIVFAGRLGAYGNLLIIDHGDQFYSLSGQLGENYKKVGDAVMEGEIIGKSSSDNTPLYFEIRQRHIAVNPVPWLEKIKL